MNIYIYIYILIYANIYYTYPIAIMEFTYIDRLLIPMPMPWAGPMEWT